MTRKRTLSRAPIVRAFTGFVALSIGLSLALSAGCDKRERLEDERLAERQQRTAHHRCATRVAETARALAEAGGAKPP